jgi:hypothetical protein
MMKRIKTASKAMDGWSCGIIGEMIRRRSFRRT